MKQLIQSALDFVTSSENRVFRTTFHYTHNGSDRVKTLDIVAPSSQDILLRFLRTNIPGYRFYNIRFEEI